MPHKATPAKMNIRAIFHRIIAETIAKTNLFVNICYNICVMPQEEFVILDLYCCAGGAVVGLSRAGFRVVGVDKKPQPHYPFEFHQADALEFPLEGYDAYWASPPCQHASRIALMNRRLRPGKYEYLNFIPQTRERLAATGKPYIIENVPGADLLNPIQLCGSWFGLDIRRHRLFESNVALFGTPCCHDWQKPRFYPLHRAKSGCLSSVVGVHGKVNYKGEAALRNSAMGIDWMTQAEFAQAIPPAYSEFLGCQLLIHLRMRGAGFEKMEVY